MQQTALSESFLQWLLVSTLYFKKIFFICLIVLFKLNSHDSYLVPRAQGTELVLAWTVQESHLPTHFSIMWNRTLSPWVCFPFEHEPYSLDSTHLCGASFTDQFLT